jgi:NAD(P)-dependent dehydrogenase (short-subunit alcohol dehydrogenase family)
MTRGTAIVTGAGRGFGRAIATRLARPTAVGAEILGPRFWASVADVTVIEDAYEIVIVGVMPQPRGSVA